jgi:hypothetical protein
MRLALLHSRGRDRPKRLFEVDLRPLGLPHFAGPLEHMRREAKRKLRDRLAGIAFDRPHQTAKGNRIGDRRMMPDHG